MTTSEETAAAGPAGRRPGRDLTVPVWLLLVVATLLSWYLGDGHGAREVATVGVLVVAFAKVYLVGRYFMELRDAPRALRYGFAGWCAVMCVVLSTLYLAGGG
jgi:hypothetical protein